MPRTPAPKALITGGTGALGRSVALALRQTGYDVHVTSETDADTARFRKDKAVGDLPAYTLDLTNASQVRGTLKQIGSPLSGLVCCAGGYFGGPFDKVTDAEVERLITMNLHATIVAVREAYPYLKKAKGASIVLISARGALKGAPGAAVYSATKAAVANLALSLGEEWVEDGIRVNAILPSIMDTPANRAAMPDADFDRWPKTQDVANVIAFLLSDKANLVSGGAIPVYGKG
ncbi:MAG: SDR family oxidoreductase [Chloroflexi bacterium]|nr:SDR family oxidoreductase [Chloroflexota bacterium]